MVEAIPVFVRITIVNGKERYTNGNINPAALNDDVHAFAVALNNLQYNGPADLFVKTERYELIGE